MGLFSTTHIHQSRTETKLVPYCREVKEFKAPTDESIRLLNEMEEKAKQNIISKIEINENVIKAIALYWWDDMVQCRMRYAIKFQLNSKEHILEGYIDKFELSQDLMKWMGLRNEGMFRILLKKYSEEIALELMKQSPDFLNTL